MTKVCQCWVCKWWFELSRHIQFVAENSGVAESVLIHY